MALTGNAIDMILITLLIMSLIYTSSGQFKSTHGHHPLNTTSHGTNHSSKLSSNEKSGENCTILYNSGSHGKHGNSSDESSSEGKNHTRGHRNSNGSDHSGNVCLRNNDTSAEHLGNRSSK
uniref:Uncharacterized protein n=1 Tax=Romanomermis culicivorax TaxID=13658 RepID=A0A915IXP8_ROMCU